jgi:hypothetical protein
MTERVGFEPTLEFPLNTLSKRVRSATRPSLLKSQGLRWKLTTTVQRMPTTFSVRPRYNSLDAASEAVAGEGN